MVDAIVRETNLTEVDCKNKEQMKTLKKALFKLYPKEADVLNDRCGTPQLFGNWISKYIEETVTTVIGEQIYIGLVTYPMPVLANKNYLKKGE